MFWLGAIHKGRPQNCAIFLLSPPTSAKFGLLQAKLTQASAFAKPPSPLVRTSFMDDPLTYLFKQLNKHVILIICNLNSFNYI